MTAPQVPPWPPTSTCGCGARIIWAVTRTGRRMPVDAEPVDADTGNITLDRRGLNGAAAPLATVHPKGTDLSDRRRVYRSHFVSCPDAAQHRRRR